MADSTQYFRTRIKKIFISYHENLMCFALQAHALKKSILILCSTQIQILQLPSYPIWKNSGLWWTIRVFKALIWLKIKNEINITHVHHFWTLRITGYNDIFFMNKWMRGYKIRDCSLHDYVVFFSRNRCIDFIISLLS